MIIKNSTPWNTNDLRKLFRRVIREVEKIEKPNWDFSIYGKDYQLDIFNSKNWRGRATRPANVGRSYGLWMMIKIPKGCSEKRVIPTKPIKIDEKGRYCFGTEGSYVALDKKTWQEKIKDFPHYWDIKGQKEEMNIEAKKILARLIIHEFYHNLGYKNWDKNNYKYDGSKDYNVDWVVDYPINLKAIIKKEKTDIKLVRYQKAINNLRTAETRFKRAKTLLNKWKSKVQRYQKVYNYK